MMKVMAIGLAVVASVARAEDGAEEEAAYVSLQVRCFPFSSSAACFVRRRGARAAAPQSASPVLLSHAHRAPAAGRRRAVLRELRRRGRLREGLVGVQQLRLPWCEPPLCLRAAGSFALARGSDGCCTPQASGACPGATTRSRPGTSGSRSRTRRSATVRTQPPLPRCARACLHALGAATAIAAMFPKVVKPVEGESLVIQYSVKLEKAHNCGGMCARLACLAAPLRSQRRSGCTLSRLVGTSSC